MADKTKNNKFVYVTATGKKYHSSSACSYIKNKETYKMILEQAKKKFEGACYRCFKNSNHVINSKIRINNNFYVNTIQNNRNNNFNNSKNNNNEQQIDLNIEEKNKNQLNNNKNLLNIIKEESKKSKKSSNSLSDIISSSSSFSKIFDKNILFENKDSDIDFNNNIYINNIYKEDLLNINNKKHIKNNKDINFNSESEKHNKIILKKSEEKNEDILNDIKNESKSFNIMRINKNKKSCLSKNGIINNNSFEFNKGKNNSSMNYFSDININDLSINKSMSEPKSISFRIYYNSKIDSGNNINKNNENDYFSSFSMSNIKLEKQNDINKNNIKSIENINEKIIISNINQKNLICSKDKDTFKFSFKIIQKGKSDINISIELGFEIIIEEDNNKINSENDESSESSDKSITISNTYQKYYIFKNITFHKKTKNITALIDFSKGKFYILSNTTENLNLSLDNNINPIFKYDSNYLNFVDILFNV